jgi:hypothetical protein
MSNTFMLALTVVCLGGDLFLLALTASRGGRLTRHYDAECRGLQARRKSTGFARIANGGTV